MRRRLHGSAGQSTVEWLVVMVGLSALAAVVNGEGEGMGAAVSGSLGDKTSYDVKTDPANADKIDHGELPPPNPADPYSIPRGSSITLSRDSYKGTEGSVTYHNITAELGWRGRPSRLLGRRAVHRLGTAAGARRARLLGPDHLAVGHLHPHRPDHGQGRPARRHGRRDDRPGPGHRDRAR